MTDRVKMSVTSGDDTQPSNVGRWAAGEDPAKRQQILEGAKRVFLKMGFDAASMGAIAKEAGVSKGTLYVYFKSKEELFEAIVEEQRLQEAEQIFALDEAAGLEHAGRVERLAHAAGERGESRRLGMGKRIFPAVARRRELPRKNSASAGLSSSVRPTARIS